MFSSAAMSCLLFVTRPGGGQIIGGILHDLKLATPTISEVEESHARGCWCFSAGLIGWGYAVSRLIIPRSPPCPSLYLCTLGAVFGVDVPAAQAALILQRPLYLGLDNLKATGWRGEIHKIP
jgi:hypothetical protein